MIPSDIVITANGTRAQKSIALVGTSYDVVSNSVKLSYSERKKLRDEAMKRSKQQHMHQ